MSSTTDIFCYWSYNQVRLELTQTLPNHVKDSPQGSCNFLAFDDYSNRFGVIRGKGNFVVENGNVSIKWQFLVCNISRFPQLTMIGGIFNGTSLTSINN